MSIDSEIRKIGLPQEQIEALDNGDLSKMSEYTLNEYRNNLERKLDKIDEDVWKITGFFAMLAIFSFAEAALNCESDEEFNVFLVLIISSVLIGFLNLLIPREKKLKAEYEKVVDKVIEILHEKNKKS